MLLKLISKQEKNNLLEVVEILSISDKPLLWDGKKKDEITPKTDLGKISIEKGEKETALIAGLKAESGEHENIFIFYENIEKRLLRKLKQFSLQKIDEPSTRVEAAVTILKEILNEKKYTLPSVPKIMLFELFLVALCDENISNIEWAILKEFQIHYQLEDYIFNDLLERAEVMSREINKTISVILE